MPASSSPGGPDRSPLSEVDRRALTRFLEQRLDHGFALAIIEAPDHADRTAILSELATTIGPGLLRLAVHELPDATNLWAALQKPFAEHGPRCLALSGFENLPGTEWPVHLNTQRDLFVRDYSVPWLVFIHPASRVPLLKQAPDFCDFAVLWLRDDRSPPSYTIAPAQTLESVVAARPTERFNFLLREAHESIEAAEFDRARDTLARFDLEQDGSTDVIDRIQRRLVGAELERQQGFFSKAEALVREARSTLARLPATTTTRELSQEVDETLGIVLHASGRLDEAAVLLHRTLAAARSSQRDHTIIATYSHNLAAVLTAQGKLDEAERMLRESLALADHTASLHELANVLLRRGAHVEAEALLRDALPRIEWASGRQHPHYALALDVLARARMFAGDDATAEKLLREALALKGSTLGREHPSYAASLHNLASYLLRTGKTVEAENFLAEALAIKAKVLGREHPSYAVSLFQLAQALAAQGRLTAAEATLRDAAAVQETSLGPNHPSLFRTLHFLAFVLTRHGRPSEAVPYLERAVQIGRSTLGPDNSEVRAAQAGLERIRPDPHSAPLLKARA
jgi:tetratricopeptide (TPR) repeat protein